MTDKKQWLPKAMQDVYNALKLLEQHSFDITAKKLAAKSGCTYGSVWQVLDDLEKNKQVVKRKSGKNVFWQTKEKEEAVKNRKKALLEKNLRAKNKSIVGLKVLQVLQAAPNQTASTGQLADLCESTSRRVKCYLLTYLKYGCVKCQPSNKKGGNDWTFISMPDVKLPPAASVSKATQEGENPTGFRVAKPKVPYPLPLRTVWRNNALKALHEKASKHYH